MTIHKDDVRFVLFLIALVLTYVCASIAWHIGVDHGRQMREKWRPVPTIAEIASDGFKGGFVE
jgi:hypothetical protein